MTQQQEAWRLRELAAVAPVLANGDLWPLTHDAAQLALQLDEQRRDRQFDAALDAMYRVALERLGEHLFSRLLCTPLCAAEPPDLAGARLLVDAALTGRLHLEPLRVKTRQR